MGFYGAQQHRGSPVWVVRQVVPLRIAGRPLRPSRLERLVTRDCATSKGAAWLDHLGEWPNSSYSLLVRTSAT